MTARDAAVQIVTTLRQAGYTAYLAGGCVRDTLLGLTPKDYDVATDARPQQVAERFKRTQLVGEAFGVVLVRLHRHCIEVATFRREWGYSDGRRPDEVIFSDAEHDAQRRDFTINGLFEDPLTQASATIDGAGHGRIIDYVGGLDDLRARRLRAIGNADERFAEDYLRMLRAVRFAARLNLDIEQRTAAAIRSLARYLGQISRERIGQEMQWMMLGPDPVRAAALMQSLHLDAPALNAAHHDAPLPVMTRLIRFQPGDALQAAAARRAVEEPAVTSRRYAVRLLAWLLDRHIAMEEPLDDAAMSRANRERAAAFMMDQSLKLIARWRRALCLSNGVRDAMRQMALLLPGLLHWHELAVAPRKRLLASAGAMEALALLAALSGQAYHGQVMADAVALLHDDVAPTPWVNGEDLIAMDLPPGPIFKQLLDTAYDAQLDGRVTSRDQALAFVRDQLAQAGQ